MESTVITTIIANAVVEVVEPQYISEREESAVVVESVETSVVSGGEQGPQGPPGAPGAGISFSQASPSTSWTINHNLGLKPVVAVVDTGGNELDAEVIHTNFNQLIIYFNVATAGSARLS